VKLQEYRDTVAEHPIQVQIVNYIKLQGAPNVFAVAIPNAGKRSPRRGRWMKAEGLTPGAADLCVLIPDGHCIWMETKTATGRQSSSQKTFELRCEKLGHDYVLVRSLDDAIRILKAFGALR
jgi:hypothetical protein